MNVNQELKKIKKIPYKVATVSEKMTLIESVLDTDYPFTKWLAAVQVFSNTRLQNLVISAHVRHQLAYYANNSEVTLSYQADLAATLMDHFQDFVDVTVIMQDVYGEQYDALVSQMNENTAINQAFLSKIQGMDSGSTIAEIANAMATVQIDITAK